jgi:hypothetical protein
MLINNPYTDNDTSNNLTNNNNDSTQLYTSDEYDNATANAAQRSIAIRSNAMKSQEDSINNTSGNGGTSSSLASSPQIEVTTLFVTDEYGILMQDSFPLEQPLNALLGIQARHTIYHTVNKVTNKQRASLYKFHCCSLHHVMHAEFNKV